MDCIVILGPTASGKTSLSIELAKKNNGEIISADSMQVYCGMDIGTAKPTIDERQGIPHYLIDIRNPNEEWTVSDFVIEATKLIPKIKSCDKTPIIVGGTGLYLWALINGFSFPIVAEDKILRENLEKETTQNLYSKLKKIDPKSCGKIHENDKKRIIRALEVYELTGKPISEGLDKSTERRKPEIDNKFTLIGINIPRELLYEKINQRVEEMISKGLIDEVRSLLVKGYSKKLRSFQALGYKEVVEYLDNKWTKDQMVEELKKRTRNFARRQMTWFRRFKDIKWVDSNRNNIADMLSYINGKSRS